MGYMEHSALEELFDRFQVTYGLPFVADDEGCYRGVATCSDEEAWPVFCQLEKSRILFYSEFPLPILPEKQGEILAYVGRANQRGSLGSFDLDVEAGRVRYKTGVELSGMESLGVAATEWQATPHLLAEFFFSNVATMFDHMAPLRELVGEYIGAIESGKEVMPKAQDLWLDERWDADSPHQPWSIN